MIRKLLATALLLFPLSLSAQEALVGKWRIDPGKMEEFNKTLEPIVAKAIAKDKLEDAAEIQKVRDKFTALLMNQRISYTRSADGKWEQEIDYDGDKQKIPVTIIKREDDGYEIHFKGRNTMTAYLHQDHARFVSASDGSAFRMIRDNAEPAKPAETPKP